MQNRIFYTGTRRCRGFSTVLNAGVAASLRTQHISVHFVTLGSPFSSCADVGMLILSSLHYNAYKILTAKHGTDQYSINGSYSSSWICHWLGVQVSISPIYTGSHQRVVSSLQRATVRPVIHKYRGYKRNKMLKNDLDAIILMGNSCIVF